MNRKKKDQRSCPDGSGKGVIGQGRGKRYSKTFKLRAVKLYEEEGYSVKLISAEMGCGANTLRRWIELYHKYGEGGLDPLRPRRGQYRRRDESADELIVDLKRKHPESGSRRISDMLKRVFLVKKSPATVQRRLKEAGLAGKPARKKPKKNPAKPRFFERSTPNQLWQSDIMSFRLKDKAVYLIGFIDDYSRYIVGLGLYRSQTGAAVLESYRRAVGDYGAPREMLTDNGRQYATWRGKTMFQRELEKDKIRHIRSQPHHPMTLGKIERFWKSILNEFLNRARFEDFEEARERIALWVKYYNHRRPHQGIGGLCPADRYYEINAQVKAVIESGIEENVLETALRGKPAKPFYMVGQLGGQSVVIRAEKRKVKMLVDGQEQTTKELTYKIERAIDDNNSKETSTGKEDLHSAAESARGAGGVDGGAPALPGGARAGDLRHAPGPVTEEVDEGDAAGNGAQERQRHRSGLAGAAGEDPGNAQRPGESIAPCQATGERPDSGRESADQAWPQNEDGHETPGRSNEREVIDEASVGDKEAQTGGSVLQGAVQSDERGRSGAGTGGVEENLLRVGESGTRSDECGNERPARCSPVPAGGSPDSEAGEKVPTAGTGEKGAADAPGAQGAAGPGAVALKQIQGL